MILGYPVFNYFVLPCLLALVVLFKSNISLRLQNVHEWAFLAFCVYMFYQTIVGVISQQDVRILVFSIFFISLFLLMVWVRTQARDSSPHVPWFLNTIGLASLYAITYLTLGIFMSFLFGDQYRGQGYAFVGSSVAIIPIFAALCILPILAHNGKNICTLKPAVLLFSAVAVCLLYDSRALSAIVFFVTCAIVFLGKPRFFYKNMFLCGAVLGLLYGGYAVQFNHPFAHIVPINTDVFSVKTDRSSTKSDVVTLKRDSGRAATVIQGRDSGRAASVFQGRDTGRIATFEVSMTAVLETNPLLGNGWYSSREQIKPFYYRIKGKKGVEEGADSPRLYLAAFHALLFDTGYLGIMLLFINWLLSLLQVVKNASLMATLYFVGVFTVVLGISAIGQCQILPIYYVFFMPNGLKFLITNSRYWAA